MKEHLNINGLPKDWKWVKLGELVDNPKQDLVDGPFGSNLKSDEYIESGVPVFKIQNIKVNRFVEKKMSFISQEKAKTLTRHSFESGDLIITKLGEPLGLCCKVPEKYPYGIIVADLMRLRPSKTKIYDNYLVNVINSDVVKKQFKSITKGTTRARVNLTIVRDINIPVPLKETQYQIVSKIEELFSELDKGIEELKTAQQQLKVYRQAVLKWAFEGKLTNEEVKDGELPEGWKLVKTKDVIEIINNGYTPTKQYLSEGSGEVPFIKVYNLNFDGTLNFTKNPTFIPKAIHQKDLKRSICLPGDVLINIVGPPLGKVSIVTNQYPEWNINQAIVMFRPNQKVLSKYLSYYLQNPVTINWLEDTSKATAGQWNVKVSTCREIPLPYCSIKEQQQIIREIESRLSVCDKIEETITNSLKQGEALRQSILKKAFEGKLV
jgi:type I restriction enzyme, S subunit